MSEGSVLRGAEARHSKPRDETHLLLPPGSLLVDAALVHSLPLFPALLSVNNHALCR